MQKFIIICFFVNAGLINPGTSDQPEPDPFCIRPIPLPLTVVKPEFNIYTRSNSTQCTVSDINGLTDFAKNLDQAGYFAQNRQVVFLIHGFWVKNPVWIDPTKDGILKAEDSTVIFVDWKYGATLAYPVCASTTQTIATAVATFAQAVSKLERFAGTNQPYIYCIGHSLGAQICGQAGRKATTSTGQLLFNRITGLDPAGPGFATCNDHLNVDKDSAACVDIIHTDGNLQSQYVPFLRSGTLKQWGHVDFYPNGGHDQPGCDPASDIFCSHKKAFEIFIATINRPDSCSASGTCSNSMDLPGSCGNSAAQKVGYYSSCHAKSTGKIEGAFYLTTTVTDPYC